MILILPILFFLLISCQSKSVEAFNFDRDCPEWLKIKIDSISTQSYYTGTVVNRYKWNDSYLFEFNIPLSSCMLCELYYIDGTKTNFPDDNTLQEYINNRTEKVFVWEYPDI